MDYSGFQSPGSRIPYQNFPGFRILQAKIFQIPESGYPYVGLSLGAWKQTLTTVNRKTQSGNGRNLLTEISLTKSSNMGSPFTVQYYRPMLPNTRQSWILDPIRWIQDSGCWIPVFSGGISFLSRVLELYSGFQSPGFRISYQNFPGFRILQAKIFQFPESGYPYVGRSTSQTFSDLFTHI